MSESPTTRLTLLVRLRDAGDAAAWAEFVDLYAPLLYGLARRHGLQDADAADLTQDVLRAVVSAVPRLDYDPAPRLLPRLAVHRRPQPGARSSPTPASASRAAAAARKATSVLRDEQPAPEEEAAWEREYQRAACSPGRRSRSAASSGRPPGRRSG